MASKPSGFKDVDVEVDVIVIVIVIVSVSVDGDGDGDVAVVDGPEMSDPGARAARCSASRNWMSTGVQSSSWH